MNPDVAEPTLVASFSGCATQEDLQRCMALSEVVCEQTAAGASEAYAIQLAVEEVCTNIVSYGYAGQTPGPMELEFWLLQKPQRALKILIHDRAPPFDPESAPEPDLEAELEDRQIGGLGWFLIKKLMDEFEYTPDTERGNRLRLIKHLGGPAGAAKP